jgi:hypothetical protein
MVGGIFWVTPIEWLLYANKYEDAVKSNQLIYALLWALSIEQREGASHVKEIGRTVWSRPWHL